MTHHRLAALRSGALFAAALAIHLSASADTATPVRLRPIAELKAAAVVHVGETADWVAITEDAVWVGSTGPFAVHRIDPRTNERVATVALPGEPCAGLATGFGSVWVPLCTQPPSLAKVDARRNSLTAVFKVGPAASEGGVAVSADSVWLVTDAKGVLARIDPQTGAIRQRIRVPPGSYNPLYAAGRIWLTRADGDEVTVIDATSGAVVGTTKTGPHPRFLTAGDGAVWTLNQRDGSLTRIDSGTQRALDTIRLGVSGHGGDIGLGAGLVWVTVRRIPLSAIDVATTRLLCQWVGDGGDSLGIGHDAIWLTDYDGGTVARYDLKDAAKRCRSPAQGLVGSWRLTRYEEHGGFTPNLELTSFCGAFLSSCEAVIGKELLESAWESKLPDDLVTYGRALLERAEAWGAQHDCLSVRDRREPPDGDEDSPASQCHIVFAAGRWCVYWGERGHWLEVWF